MPLELDQIQGNIVPGFYKDAQDFLFIRFPDARAGRKWLADLQPKLSSAADILPVNADTLRRRQHNHDDTAAPHTWINIALSYAGLRALQIPDVQRFAFEFTSNTADRADRLGDTPVLGNFDVGGADDTEAHALLLLGANTPQELNQLQDQLGVRVGIRQVAGMELIAWHRGHSRGDGREHFGFKDGKSQPVPKLFGKDGWASTPDGQIVAAGEFILGQPDECGSTAFHEPAWARNGSYLVFRRFRQLVDEFKAAVDQAAPELAAHGIASTGDELAGKLMGRTKDADQNPTAADFASDQLGDKCPLFSHIRKANPRDRKDDQPNRHRIIRRAITYGADRDADRGLLFLAYQASIGRGFEHIATQWLGVSTFPHPAPGLPIDPVGLSVLETPGLDPVTAWMGPSQASHRIFFHKAGAGHANGDFIPVDLQSFVEVKGCGYFFAPSLNGITDMLASADVSASA